MDQSTDSLVGNSGNDCDKPQQLNPITRKINKILETQINDDKASLDALRALSGVLKENSLQSRRNLRSAIEQQSLSVNEELLGKMKLIKESVDSLHQQVSMFNQSCHSAMDRVQTVKSETLELVEETNRLKVECAKVEAKQKIADGFLNSFQMSTE